jgi:hypothetical protein
VEEMGFEDKGKIPEKIKYCIGKTMWKKFTMEE